MLYLIAQIAFILTVAILIGMASGWWMRGFLGKVSDRRSETIDDPFDARFRLEQCHRENAALRRDLKEANEKAERLQARIDQSDMGNNETLENLERYEVRVQALLDDLQVRDDTIAGLERELESLRRSAT